MRPLKDLLLRGKRKSAAAQLQKEKTEAARYAADLADVKPLFDPEFYLSQADDLPEDPAAALDHFLQIGWTQGLNPNEDFDTAFYLTNNPDVAASDLNPYLHFLRNGRHEGRAPRPKPAASVKSVADLLAAQRLELADDFDAEFYLTQADDLPEDPAAALDHFLQIGWTQGLNPNKDFDTSFYLTNNPDVAASDLNPYLHFLRNGRHEGRAPRPKPAASVKSVDDLLAAQGLELAEDFDAEFYLTQADDLPEDPAAALDHFLQIGWTQGLNPNKDFDTSFYLTNNPDVAASDTNPYLHFLRDGRQEGRAPRPKTLTPMNDGIDPAVTRRAEMAEEFDSEFYLATYHDVLETGVDPLDHYIESGWREGRRPNPQFDTEFYLDSYPDVRIAEINPFWHYIVAGQTEGRLARHPGGYKADLLRGLQPLETQVETWIETHDPGPLGPTLEAIGLAEAISNTHNQAQANLMVSIGHDAFQSVTGGVQFCIQKEMAQARNAGWVHINLHPVQPLPRLAHASDMPDPSMKLVVNGKAVGSAPMSVFIHCFEILAQTGHPCHLVLHSLLGHQPEQVAQLASAARCDGATFWLHDFLTICPSFALQRNGVSFCNAPEQGSMACRVCVFGAERPDHLMRMKKLFQDVPMDVIAPSRSTKNFWQKRSDLPHRSLRILPHAHLNIQPKGAPEALQKGPARIAYVGAAVPHKGWNLFNDLVGSYHSPEKVEFYYFGIDDVASQRIKSVPVRVTADDPDAMIEALKAAQIDVVLHWASWPETFSFSTFEALAAGAYVITNGISGNVADIVRETATGRVLPDLAALEEVFEGSGLNDIVVQARMARSTRSLTRSIGDMAVRSLRAEPSQ